MMATNYDDIDRRLISKSSDLLMSAAAKLRESGVDEELVAKAAMAMAMTTANDMLGNAGLRHWFAAIVAMLDARMDKAESGA